jgi:hypothetical protein
MDTTEKCTEVMDFTAGWAEWRAALKKLIKESHTYYKDESVQLMMNGLESFLNKRVCESTPEERLIEAMWNAATRRQRETLATLLLKIPEKI